MASRLAAVLPSFLAVIAAQQIGSMVAEVHPKLPTQFCTKAAGCVTQQTTLVSDALSRYFHAADDPSVSCANFPFNATLCPDAETCAKNCVLEGIEYGSRGVLTSGTALTLRQYLFDGQQFDSVSPRLYLLAEDEKNYQLLKLVNQELSYEVDVSKLGCGMNGALYLSEMDGSGSRSDSNPAGATYGTGYCDAQCFNTTWINGLPNMNNSGACCNEMDIWEANSMANALTPHTCNATGSFLCSGAGCSATGVCDKPGCGFNPYGSGAKEYYGPGLTVDTSRPFTVVTQFLTADNTSTGGLSEIRRLYIQDGKLIQNAAIPAPKGAAGADATEVATITQDFCEARNASAFNRLGGVKGMGESLGRGMVLVFSIWNSAGDFMSWLDSGNAGPCNATAGDPKLIIENNPEVAVTFSNIRWGDIGATFNATGSGEADSQAGKGAQKAESEAGRMGVPVAVSLVSALVMVYFLS